MVSNYKRKGGWGGKRAGSGGKRKNVPRVTYSVEITPAQAELLKTWGGGSLDEGLRWLVDAAAHLLQKVSPAEYALRLHQWNLPE